MIRVITIVPIYGQNNLKMTSFSKELLDSLQWLFFVLLVNFKLESFSAFCNFPSQRFFPIDSAFSFFLNAPTEREEWKKINSSEIAQWGVQSTFYAIYKRMLTSRISELS